MTKRAELTRSPEGAVRIDIPNLRTGERVEVWRSRDGCMWYREARLDVPSVQGDRVTIIDSDEGDFELHYQVRVFAPDGTKVGDACWMPPAAAAVYRDLVLPAWFDDDV